MGVGTTSTRQEHESDAMVAIVSWLRARRYGNGCHDQLPQLGVGWRGKRDLAFPFVFSPGVRFVSPCGAMATRACNPAGRPEGDGNKTNLVLRTAKGEDSTEDHQNLSKFKRLSLLAIFDLKF